MMNMKNTIARTLKELREEAGYSIERLAQFFNGDTATVSNWENGTEEPSIYDCCVLSGLYGVSMDNMFCALSPEELLPDDMQSEYAHESWLNRMERRYAC